jgi:hypothetical protein
VNGRATLACAAVGAVLGLSLGSLAAPARADDPAPALGSWTLSASGHGVELLLAGQVDATIPDAASTFETGGLGYGRASIAWPGGLVGNVGDSLNLLTGGAVPKDFEPIAQSLNDPIRAEARSPSGPADISFGTVPGIEMHSTAGATGSTADTSVAKTTNPGLISLGNASASSATRIDGPAAIADAGSAVGDISIAGGLIKIGSITSVAHARSDGTTGSGTASTTVAGVTVAGVPATIDETGLRLGTSSSPVTDLVSATVNQLLQQAGAKVVITQPVIQTTGRSATVGAGVLLVSIGTDAAATFGGANASATASLPFDVAAEAPAGAIPDVSSGPLGLGGGDLSVPGGLPLSLPPATQGADVAAPGPTAVPTRPIGFLGTANPIWLGLAGAVATVLAAAALRRVGTLILDAPTTCDAGGTP